MVNNEILRSTDIINNMIYLTVHLISKENSKYFTSEVWIIFLYFVSTFYAPFTYFVYILYNILPV